MIIPNPSFLMKVVKNALTSNQSKRTQKIEFKTYPNKQIELLFKILIVVFGVFTLLSLLATIVLVAYFIKIQISYS